MLSNSCVPVPVITAAPSATRPDGLLELSRRARTWAVQMFGWERPPRRCAGSSGHLREVLVGLVESTCWARTPPALAARCAARARSPVPLQHLQTGPTSRSAASGLPALSSSGTIENGWFASASSWRLGEHRSASSRSSRPVASSPCSAMSAPSPSSSRPGFPGCPDAAHGFACLGDPLHGGSTFRDRCRGAIPDRAMKCLLVVAFSYSINRIRGSRIEYPHRPGPPHSSDREPRPSRPSSSPTRFEQAISPREPLVLIRMKSLTSITWNESSIRARTRVPSRWTAQLPAMARSRALQPWWSVAFLEEDACRWGWGRVRASGCLLRRLCGALERVCNWSPVASLAALLRRHARGARRHDYLRYRSLAVVVRASPVPERPLQVVADDLVELDQLRAARFQAAAKR